MKQKITPDEKIISGKWLKSENGVITDENCKRIEYLTDHYLEKIDTDSSGWNKLYKDPADGRFWVKTYPNSEMHGGGPPHLKEISPTEAQKQFQVDINHKQKF